jgi:zinc protease
MRFGPEINAYTSFDETVYGIEVPVEIGPDGRRRVPDRALMVIDDWSRNITFDPQDVDDERLVILEEYRFRLGARDRINRQIFPVLFRGSPYANRLPIGLLEVIENATAEQLRAFYERWYRPENMAIIIVGDFDTEYLEASLAQHFPAPPSNEPFTRPRFNLSEPERGSLMSLVLTDDELTRSRVDLYWKRESEPRRQDLASYRESIIDNLVHTMLALRFEEAAARSDSPYVWAGAGMANYGYSSRYYILAAQAMAFSATDSLRELLLTRESLSRHGFRQWELDTAKAFLVSHIEQVVSEEGRRPSENYVRAFTRHFIRGEAVPDPEWELEAINSLLPGISLREINRTVRGYFADDDLTVIISAPEAERDSLPSDAGISAIVAETRRARVPRPVAQRPQGELLAYIPQGGRIVSELADSETGSIRILLSNGAEVILKETNNRNNEIILYALARGGTLSAPPETAASAALAAEMLNVSGLGSYSRTDLMRMLSGKQVSMSFWTQTHVRGFQGSAAVQDINTLFEMLYLAFTQPRLDPDAVNTLLAQHRSRMVFQENDPNAAFNREIVRTIFGNPRFHPMEMQDLERVSLEDAMAFINGCFNPGDYVFVFTGNLNLPMFRPLLETYLASIPRSAAFGESTGINPQRPNATERVFHRGREERSMVYMGWFNPHVHSEENNAVVAGLSEYLAIQLNDRIREALGGVYAISSWVSLSPFFSGGELSGGVIFACDPERVEELSAAVMEEFLKIAEGEIDTGVLVKAIEALVQNHEQSIQSNLHIAQSYANSAIIFNSPLSRLDRRPGLFRALNPGDIQRAAIELLGGSQVRLFLYPEA